MQTRDSHDEDDKEVVPIPIDRETIRLLAKYARDVGRPPLEVAGDLLRDLLIDDAAAHRFMN